MAAAAALTEVPPPADLQGCLLRPVVCKEKRRWAACLWGGWRERCASGVNSQVSLTTPAAAHPKRSCPRARRLPPPRRRPCRANAAATMAPNSPPPRGRRETGAAPPPAPRAANRPRPQRRRPTPGRTPAPRREGTAARAKTTPRQGGLCLRRPCRRRLSCRRCRFAALAVPRLAPRGSGGWGGPSSEPSREAPPPPPPPTP
mmetsp:Transcript_5680/g.18575  ORF Transcript_5680/g.18575 Transcript_5680/m.18575 type:complete len:202 (+) Transcript_5680:212-817(+)